MCIYKVNRLAVKLNESPSLIMDIGGGSTEFIIGNKEKRSNSQLSIREREILKLVAQGNSSKQIADKLFLSIHTVITHRKNITGKLGVKSISGLTLYAAINNIIDQPL